jgi:hypothetical protein
MDEPFFQRSGTLGGNFVTEEGDLGCFEYTFRRVPDERLCDAGHDESPREIPA